MEITPKKNKAGLTILILVITGCLLFSVGLVIAGYFLFKATKEYIPPTTSGPTPTLQTIVVVPGETPTPGSADTESTGVPPSVAAQMDRIQEQVLSFRGLPLKNELMRDMMTETELEDVVVNDFFADYSDEESAKDAIELHVMGLLPADFDLHQFYLDLYSEQIAGYYDSETKEMYVIGSEFKGPERMTYAHEFTHVLQDQNYDLETLLSDDACEADSEYCAAVSALVEGDATLSEQLWFVTNGTDQDRNEINEFYDSYQSPVYDSAPEYMKQDFLFPYSQGFDFVYDIYSGKKWAGVNDLYVNLPVSTEQILHPEKYPKEVPVKVEITDLAAQLGAGWTEYDRNNMGEWYTSLILSSGFEGSFRLPAEDANVAAAGWGGDTYVFLFNDNNEDTAFVWLSTWDTQKDSNEFFAASQEYGSLRWGTPSENKNNASSWDATEEGMVRIFQNGKYVLWVISPDGQAVDTVLPLVNFGGY